MFLLITNLKCGATGKPGKPLMFIIGYFINNDFCKVVDYLYVYFRLIDIF